MLLRLLFHRVALLLSSLLAVQAAQASHILGGDIAYQALGNNQYRVRATLSRDCIVGTQPNTAVFTYRNTGCAGTGTVVPMVLAGSRTVGTPFCAQSPYGASPCGYVLPTNYELSTYEATVTLPPGHWVFSLEEVARPALANAGTALSNSNFYIEALLDNRSGLSNTSPVFTTPPLFFTPWKQSNRFSCLAFDADGDSLVYSLVAPLASCNNSLPYQTLQFPSPGPYIDLTPPGAAHVLPLFHRL